MVKKIKNIDKNIVKMLSILDYLFFSNLVLTNYLIKIIFYMYFVAFLDSFSNIQI